MSELPTYPPPAYPPLASPPPPAPRRRIVPVVLAAVVAVLLVAVAVVVPLVLSRQDADEVAREGPVNLDEVDIYDDLDPSHTPEDVDYPQSPAVGGPHDPVWLDCGVYGDPVREENVVHDLEHGTVWIAYDPDAGVDVDTLAGLLPQNGIVSPYPDLGSPVVVTVWGRQLTLDGADDPRLPLFVDTYAGGETAPEPFASCAGGVRSPDGHEGSNV
jgi:hypothetical protein